MTANDPNFSVRIHIFGASGSGCTTLGGHIARRLQIPFFDADDYYWIDTDPPYTTKRHPAERLQRIENDVRGHDAWVLAGSVCGWGDALVSRFTLAVFLELEAKQRLERLAARERLRFGSRIDEGGDMFLTHREFINWAAAYDGGPISMRSLKLHEFWIQQLPCDVLRVEAVGSPEEIADHILQYIGA